MRKVAIFLVLLALAVCHFDFFKKKNKHFFEEEEPRHRPHHQKHRFEKFEKHHNFRHKKMFEGFQPENIRKFWKKRISNNEVKGDRIKEIAHKVNKLRTTWQATVYDRDYKPLLGAFLHGGEKLEEKEFKEINANLPENFDLRKEYPNCESIKEIRDQANCGSCWAFGAAEAMSDRLCIKSGQKDQRRISSQNLLTCCYACGFGCDGGYPASAWSYWKSTGLPTGGLYGDKSTCQPYFLPPCDHHMEGSHGACPDTVDTPDCVKNCDAGSGVDYKSDIIKSTSAYSVSGEKNIMQELYDNGSVEASFTVYEDFLSYKSGIYQYVAGSYLGGHAIKIIGWGVENGVKYWICVNSWNEEWGENGIFRIIRGENECGIEGSINAGLP